MTNRNVVVSTTLKFIFFAQQKFQLFSSNVEKGIENVVFEIIKLIVNFFYRNNFVDEINFFLWFLLVDYKNF